jgi:hypothetical protein
MKNLLKLSMILVVVSMLVFTTSCEKDKTTTDPTPTATGFTFAAVGHQWITANDSSGVNLGNDTSKITASLGSNKWMMNDGSVMYCSSNEFGFIQDTLTMILCKADAKVNDQYTIDLGQGFTMINKIVAVGQSVTVPAGTFSCFKIELSVMGQVFSTFYISKQFGMIKSESDGTISSLISKNF